MQDEQILMPIEAADIQIGIHPTVLRLLVAYQWEDVIRVGALAEFQVARLPYQADGITVVAGESWLLPFEEAP